MANGMMNLDYYVSLQLDLFHIITSTTSRQAGQLGSDSQRATTTTTTILHKEAYLVDLIIVCMQSNLLTPLAGSFAWLTGQLADKPVQVQQHIAARLRKAPIRNPAAAASIGK